MLWIRNDFFGSVSGSDFSVGFGSYMTFFNILNINCTGTSSYLFGYRIYCLSSFHSSFGSQYGTYIFIYRSIVTVSPSLSRFNQLSNFQCISKLSYMITTACMVPPPPK